jgi:hypothetical protein
MNTPRKMIIAASCLAFAACTSIRLKRVTCPT